MKHPPINGGDWGADPNLKEFCFFNILHPKTPLTTCGPISCWGRGEDRLEIDKE